MTGSEKKLDFIAFGEDAKKLLKYISDSVSNAPTEAMEAFPIDFSRLKKLKLGIKTESGQTSVKCLVAYRRAAGTPPDFPDATRPTADKPEFNAIRTMKTRCHNVLPP